jgi:hypothetical protein
MRFVQWLAVTALVPTASATLLATPAIAQERLATAAMPTAAPTGSKVWLGRYAEYEAFLTTAKIERFETTKTGITMPKHCFFAPGGLAAGAICKNLPPDIVDGFYESYKSEIAAYKMDRLLGMDMVPPTVERSVNGNLQSAQLWVENVITLNDVVNKKLESKPADLNAWPYQLTQIDRPFLDRVKALDGAALRREVGDLVQGGVVSELLRRRDEIVKMFDKLVKDKGESQVFNP